MDITVSVTGADYSYRYSTGYSQKTNRSSRKRMLPHHDSDCEMNVRTSRTTSTTTSRKTLLRILEVADKERAVR
jgi:hypothetical protein